MATSGQSWRKWLLAIIGTLLLLIGITFGSEKYGEFYLQEHLPQLSDSLGYQLNLDDVNLSVWQRSIRLAGISATRNPSAPHSISPAQFNVDAVIIEGISPWNWFWNDRLDVNRISINNPSATLMGRIDDFTSDSSSLGNTSAPRDLLPFTIQHLHINRGNARLIHPADSSEEASVQNFRLHVQDLTFIPSLSQDTLSSTVQYSTLQAEFTELYSQTPEHFYDFSLKHGRLSSQDSSVVLDSLAITPRYPRYEFARQFGYETDRINLLIPKISLRRFDLEALIHGNVRAGHLLLQNPRMEIFHDKHMPFPTKPHIPLPQDRIKELTMTLHLDTISVEQGRISYSEHLPRVDKPGTVVFDDLNASIYHLSNDSTRQSSNALTLDARTSIMDAGPLHVSATFPLNNASHRVKGSLGSMPMQELNDVTEPLGLISITSGQIHSLEFDMQLNKREATGTAWLEYSNLQIKVLKSSKSENNRTKELLSFIANTFKVKSDNQQPLREGTVSFERDPQKSIFSYWWKALFSGLKSSVGL